MFRAYVNYAMNINISETQCEKQKYFFFNNTKRIYPPIKLNTKVYDCSLSIGDYNEYTICMDTMCIEIIRELFISPLHQRLARKNP